MESEKIARCVCGGRAAVVLTELGFTVRCEHDPGYAEVPAYKTESRAISQWNNAQENMESGTVCVVRAYHAGLSYGNYMASIGSKPVAVSKKEAPVVDPRLLNRCVQCGMIIPAEVRSKRYCSPICAHNYREAQRRLREKRKRMVSPKPERRCVLCGDPVDPQSGRIKYCSEHCAREAQRQQMTEHEKRRRAERTAQKAAAPKKADV